MAVIQMDKSTSKISHSEASFQADGDDELYFQVWRGSGSSGKAVVLLVHGYAEHSGRYQHVATRLAAAGYEVWSFDLRGHGRSPGRRCYISSFDEYLHDLQVFLDLVRKNTPGKPLFLLGHSMGGAIVTLYVLAKQPEVRGIVLSAPALKLSDNISPFLVTISQIVGRLFPKLQTVKLDSSKICRDPEVVKLYDADPLIYRGGTLARTGAEIVRATHRIQARMHEFTLPVLILHGSDDQIGDPAGSRQLHERAQSSDKTLKIYPGLYHEIMNEPEKEEVLDDIVNWLDQHV